MRLKAKKTIATIMFAQRFVGFFKIRERKTMTIGITINIAIPNDLSYSHTIYFPRLEVAAVYSQHVSQQICQHQSHP
jgi:hypothetical protein